MISNLPFLAAHQEFQARHKDMLAAARSGEVVDPKTQPKSHLEILANMTVGEAKIFKEAVRERAEFDEACTSEGIRPDWARRMGFTLEQIKYRDFSMRLRAD